MTQVTVNQYAVRNSDNYLNIQIDTYVVAGTEGTDINDPRIVSVGNQVGDFILISRLNEPLPPEDYTFLTDPQDIVDALQAYQDQLSAARIAQDDDNGDYVASFESRQSDAYDELITNGFSVDAARFLVRLDYP